MAFIKEFVALVRFIATGEARIGELRANSRAIHRGDDDTVVVLHPPQEAMDESEEERWRVMYGEHYAD
jgi:hypothetical protein